MTADAKVGLLLGLFFIVIIAFLVNGLPNYMREENTSPPNASIITPSGQDMVLGSGVPEAAHRLYPPRGGADQRNTEPPQERVVLENPSVGPRQVEIPDLVPQHQTPVGIVKNPPAAVQEVAEVPKAKTHIVKSGEILPVIAKIYYGSEEGNRRIVIQKLYEANTDILKSADLVTVGQKLTIPSLDELLNTSGAVVKAPKPSEGLLKNFPDIFKRVEKKDTPSISEYTVREGDNLWSIAQQKLGNGNRYKEIAKLNKSRIKSANDVAVGTRLQIPPQ